MKYTLVYTHQAIKDIRKLDSEMKKRIGKSLLRYEEDPLKYADKLIEPKLGTYRLNVLNALEFRFSEGICSKHRTTNKEHGRRNKAQCSMTKLS